jgi:hypothetical protein
MKDKETGREEDDKTDHQSAREDSIDEEIDQEKAGAVEIAPVETTQEHEYIKGAKLWSVVAAITLVFFLLTLDMAIIAAVRAELDLAKYRSLIK